MGLNVSPFHGVVPGLHIMPEHRPEEDLDPECMKNAATIDSVRRGVLALREVKAEAFEKCKGMELMGRKAAKEKEKAAEEAKEIERKVDAPVVVLKECVQPVRPRPITGQFSACLEKALDMAAEDEKMEKAAAIKAAKHKAKLRKQ